jgi:TetR/AcrR family transcriptional regulator, regulator of autoinduction and epiphytic fitness
VPDASALLTSVEAGRTGSPPTAETPTDGRVARSYRTNELLVRAVLEIIERDGHLRPTASQVARRAGVSRRALYVHFETIEELIATALERRAVEVCAEWEDPPSDAPLDHRVDVFCRRWAELSEELVPLRRAVAVHEPFSPQVGAVRQQTRSWARAVVEQAFSPELDPLAGAEREALTRALHHATSWSAWDELRTQGAAADAAHQAMRRLIGALLVDTCDELMADIA